MKRLTKFEQWVIRNHIGTNLLEMPENLDMNNEICVNIGGLQYRVQLGNIPKKMLDELTSDWVNFYGEQ